MTANTTGEVGRRDDGQQQADYVALEEGQSTGGVQRAVHECCEDPCFRYAVLTGAALYDRNIYPLIAPNGIPECPNCPDCPPQRALCLVCVIAVGLVVAALVLDMIGR